MVGDAPGVGEAEGEGSVDGDEPGEGEADGAGESEGSGDAVGVAEGWGGAMARFVLALSWNNCGQCAVWVIYSSGSSQRYMRVRLA